MSKYMTEFLSLKSCPDILGTVGFLGKKPEKEISEAMAVIQKLKNIVMKEPNKYTLIDICSGNALVPVIAVHLLPVNEAVAIDKLQRERNWVAANKFVYVQKDIYEMDWDKINTPTILTAVHSCSGLAEKAVDIYNKTEQIKHLILMPCCIGNLNSSLLRFIKQEANRDLAWVTKLAMQCIGNVKVGKDNHVLSPRRYIITAGKGDQK